MEASVILKDQAVLGMVQVTGSYTQWMNVSLVTKVSRKLNFSFHFILFNLPV